MTGMIRVQTTVSGYVGGPGLNTAYFRPGTSGGVTADATDCVARVRTFFDAIKGFYSVGTTIQVDTSVDQIEDTTGALTGSLTSAASAVVSGTGAGDRLPPSTALLLRLNTGIVVNGRFLKGRWYLSPFVTSQNDVAGVPEPVTMSNCVTAANAMLTGTTASFPVVWHRPGGAGAGTSMAVNGYSVWGSWAVLRSRRD